jgi:2-phospho-L-lactate guanylyltransferase (CobY/MobA/RfbA family)
MALWCLVPIKPFSSGKSRLAEYLTVDQRILLNRHLAENTIQICKSVKEIEQVLIVSSGREMHRFAIKCGAEFVEEPLRGINAALDLAADYAQTQGADSLLVIHSDLPSIRACEIENLIHLSMTQNGPSPHGNKCPTDQTASKHSISVWTRILCTTYKRSQG